MGELIRLKAILNLRKFSESMGSWLPIHVVPIVMWLLVLILTIVCYVVSTSLHGKYFYEILGIFYMLIFLSWTGGALTGLRLNEYLEFSSLGPYPISKIRIFIASVLGGLMDPSAVMLFGPLWGVSLCIAQFSHWGWAPVLMLLNALFLLKCVAVSQVIVFFYQYTLHRSRVYRFFFSVIFPMFALLGAISVYGVLLIAIPMIDSFSSPEFDFLGSTAWLSSSIFILMIQSLVEGQLVESLIYLVFYCTEFLLVFWCGGVLVRRLQFGNDDEAEERFSESGFGGKLDKLISRVSFISSELRTLLQKDWKIIFREPSTNSTIIVQMFSGLVLWVLSYGFAVFSVELSQGAIKEFFGPNGGISFFKPETIGYVWPVFYYGSLWLIGVSFANNIFGRERRGINQLFLLPVSSWQILLSKNLSLLIILAVPSFIISLIASFVGVQSWHILQSLWLSFVMSLILVFLAGNFISILFPLKIESGASQNLSRIGFVRSLLLSLTGVLTSVIGGYLSLPIFLFCVYPFVQTPQYLIPFSEQTNAQLVLGFQSLINHASAHFYALLYAFGAYVVGLFMAEKLLDNRRDQLLNELNRLES